MQARSQRRLYEGFGEANTRAFELVLVPLVFGFVGFLIGNAVGLVLPLTLGLGIFGLIGAMLKAYYEYKAAMAKQEEGMPWNR